MTAKQNQSKSSNGMQQSGYFKNGRDLHCKEENGRIFKMGTWMSMVVLLILIPLSMLLRFGTSALVVVSTVHNESIPLTRWLVALLIPILVVCWGLKGRTISLSGGIMGFVIGFIITLSSYIFLACLFIFYITGSRATKFRSSLKHSFEEKFKKGGGERGWVQVVCNTGLAVQVSLLYILDTGCGERPIDFVTDYRESWFGLAFLGTIACCNADTWASELGTVVSKGSPYLITTFKKVPKGTNGGVSLAGLVFSFLGGLIIGLTYYIALIITVDSSWLHRSPPQWPVMLWGGFAGLVGSLLDSFFGATLQYSGLDKKTGTVIVGEPRKGVQHISGIGLLDNHSVNLLSHIFTGFLTPQLASLLWP